jgi:hypothetical protein
VSDNRFSLNGRMIVGIVVITLGVLFTLDNFGLIDSGAILRGWPVLLIGYGIMRLSGFCCRQNFIVGILFTGAGTLFLAHNYGWVHTDPWDLWPVFLILIGVSMVMGAFSRAHGRYGDPDASSNLTAFALMSGSERKISSQNFRGGDVTAIMGGHVLDLRSAKVAEGGSAVLDLLVVMGGVDIRVPPDWEVSSEALPVMGAVEDNSKAPGGPITGRLVLKGIILMGGVEVKN